MVLAAVIFDFDGVIVDSESPEYDAWAEIFRRHGCRLDAAEWLVGVGTRGGFDPYATLVARASRPVADEAAVRREKRLLAAPSIDHAEALPGVMGWLSECRTAGLPVAIASSSVPSAVARHLDRLGLEREFACVSCCDGTVRPKPYPDTYRAACQHLGVDPANALAVEDSPNGVAAAVAAGLKCVAVPYGLTRGLDFSAADVVVDSLAATTLRDVSGRLFPPG